MASGRLKIYDSGSWKYASTGFDSTSSITSASYATTSSYATIAQNVLGSIASASYATTASYALNANSSFNTSSFVQNSQTSSMSVSSATTSTTSSFASSVLWANVTGRPTNISSFTNDSLYVISSQTSSFVINSQTSSFVLNSQTSSMTVATASYVSPSMFITTAQTASYVLNAVSSSYATNALNATTATTATSATSATNATNASNVPWTGVSSRPTLVSQFTNDSLYVASSQTSSMSSSYAVTSSYSDTAKTLLGSVTSASYATTASYATIAQNVLGSITSASYSITSSFASTAQTLLGSVVSASYAATASLLLGSVVSASNATTASYALTAQTLLDSVVSASYALSASYSPSSVDTSTFAKLNAPNQFVGNQVISGTLIISGSNTANTGVSFRIGAGSDGNASFYISGSDAVRNLVEIDDLNGREVFVIGPTGSVEIRTSPNQKNALPNSPLHVDGKIDTYLQANIQNDSGSVKASSDWVATNDIGNDTTYYVDMGIQSSLSVDPTFSIVGANDSYLYAQTGSIAIGNASAGGNIKFFGGGTLSSNLYGQFNPFGHLQFTTSSFIQMPGIEDIAALAPAGHGLIGMVKRASRPFPRVADEFGYSWTVQPGIMNSRIQNVSLNTTTTLSTFGIEAPTITATLSHPAPTERYGRFAQFICAAATSGTSTGFGTVTAEVCRPTMTGSGGFFWYTRIIPSSALYSGSLIFAGLTTLTLAFHATLPYRANSDSIGFTYRTSSLVSQSATPITDPAWMIVYSNGTTAESSSTNMPFLTSSYYDMALYCPEWPMTGSIYWRIADKTQGTAIEGAVSGTLLPRGGQFMRMGVQLQQTNTIAAAKQFWFKNMYCEVDR